MDAGDDAGADAGADGGTDGGIDAGCPVIAAGGPLDLCLQTRRALADALHRCGHVWDPAVYAEQISNPFCFDLAARVESGDFGFDPDAGATCVKDLQDAGPCYVPFPSSVACDDWITGSAPVHPPPMVGGPCGAYGNCGDIGWCPADPRSCQTCQPFRTDGEPCTPFPPPYGTYDPSYQGACDPTLDCTAADGGRVCVDHRIPCGGSGLCKPNLCLPQRDGGAACMPLPEGADCTSATNSAPCGSGLTCRTDALDAGHCEPKAALGAKCDHDTFPGQCADAGADCIDGTCQIIPLHSRDAGFECTWDGQCGDGFYCFFAQTCGSDFMYPAPCPGYCARYFWRGLGEPCPSQPVDAPPVYDTACMLDLRCGSDFTCTTRPPTVSQCDLPKLGEACDTTCAYGQGSCFLAGSHAHTCQPFLDAGEPCLDWYDQDQTCASGYCLPDGAGVLVCAVGCSP